MISIATSIVTLLGMWLVSRKDWRGWAVGLANQALWLWLIIDTHAWGLLILTVSLVAIYTKALIAWRRVPTVSLVGYWCPTCRKVRPTDTNCAVEYPEGYEDHHGDVVALYVPGVVSRA